MKPGIKLNKALVALAAACLLLAVMVPAVAATDYPHNGQFIAYYNPSAITTGTAPANAGTTYVNPAATTTKSAAANTLTKITTTTTPSSTDWPQFHYNAAHIGMTSSTTPSSLSSRPSWSKNLKAIGTMNPIIANGKVFILTGYAGFDEPNGLTTINLTCLDESTGAILWNHTLPRIVHYGSYSSPATDGTYVYVSSDYQHFAIDMSGNEVWNFTGFDVNMNGGPSIGGGNVYLSDWGDYFSLNKNTGALNWVFNNTKVSQYPFEYAQGSPAYDATDGSVYVTAYTYSGVNGTGSRGYLYKVDSSGNESWSVQSIQGENFCGSATFDNNNVYVASYNFGGDGTLYAYNKNTGALVWSNMTERTDATPAVANGVVYITGGWNGGDYGSAPPGVRAYNANYGTLVWSNTSIGAGGWTDSASVANGYVFAGHETGNNALPDYCYNQTYMLYAANGTVASQYLLGGGATAAIANGKIYTIGNNGYLYRW